MRSLKKRTDVIHANSLYRHNKLTQLTVEISDESESLSLKEILTVDLKVVISILVRMIFRVVMLESRNITRKNYSPWNFQMIPKVTAMKRKLI